MRTRLPIRVLWERLDNAAKLVAQNDFGQALMLYEGILNELHSYESSAKESLLARALTESASVLRDQGFVSGFGGAYHRYKQALGLYRDLGDVRGYGTVALYLGACNEMLGRLSYAGGFYRLAVDALARAPNLANLRARAFLRLATVFTKLKVYDAASDYMSLSFGLAEEGYAPPEDLSFIMQKRAILQFGRGDSDTPFDDLDKARSLLPKSAVLGHVQLHSTYALLAIAAGEESDGLQSARNGLWIARTYSFGHQVEQLERILRLYEKSHDVPTRKRVDYLSGMPAYDSFVRHQRILLPLASLKAPNIRQYVRELASVSEGDVLPATSSVNILQGSLPFRSPVTLVLKGGGAKGLAFVGALRVLAAHYQFTGFAGTSAGAIAAVLLAAGYSIEELEEILLTTNFDTFKDGGLVCGVWRLLMKHGGIYRGEAFAQWLTEMLCRKLDVTIPPKMRDLPFRAVVYACGWPNGGTIRFDTKGENADVLAALAVRGSMSIPGFFNPPEYNGMKLFDGGLLNNFPYEDLALREPERSLLGLYLANSSSPYWITGDGLGLCGILRAMIGILLDRDEPRVASAERSAIAIIDPSPIRTMDFSLGPQEKKLLILSGQVAGHDLLRRAGLPFNPSEAITAQQQLAMLQGKLKTQKPRLKGHVRLLLVVATLAGFCVMLLALL